jgi:UDP-2-acetamido-3-amino-2,3-dideoxy-glucuronate N-acetyltransferase
MKKNLAVIGCGSWGKNLVRSFYDLGALAIIADRSESQLRPLQDKYPDLVSTTDRARVIDNPEIEAVVIATPAATHHALAKEAFMANKDVFVEKPLAMTYKEGEELVDIAEGKKRILMVGHILEYHPAITALKGLVDSGELGKIQYAYSHRLNLGRFRTEENILWSFAPHDISVLLYLLQEMPFEVSAQGGNYLHPRIADVTVTNLHFPSGVKAHIFVSWLHPYKEQKLVVIGDKKMIMFDDLNSQNKLWLYDHKIDWVDRAPIPKPGEARPVPIEGKEPLREECEHFLASVRSRQAPRTDGRSGLRVLKILEACQESLLEKGRALAPVTAKKDLFFVHETARVDDPVEIGEGTKIWHYSHVQSGSRLGKSCVLGQNVNIGNNVTIGHFVKIQNNVSVYEGVTLEDYVFCGPSMVFTNITRPRSRYPQRGSQYYQKTLVREGASLGANSTILCGLTIGRYAFVGAGSVVTKDVPDFALVVGNPARVVGWTSEAGQKLNFNKEGYAFCKKSQKGYALEEGLVREVPSKE